MTYAALAEIALHLNEFTIHDYHSEGLYQIRASVYYEKPVQLSDMEGHKTNTVETRVGISNQKYFAKPYMVQPNTNPGSHSVVGAASLSEQYMTTDRLNMDSRPGYNKLNINQISLFRIDLPCYPYLWQDGLYLELEALVMIDPVQKIKPELQVC